MDSIKDDVTDQVDKADARSSLVYFVGPLTQKPTMNVEMWCLCIA